MKYFTIIGQNKKVQKLVAYTVPTYIGAGISLFVFPVIASLLGPKLFGQLDLMMMVGIVMAYLFAVGWGSAHNRYYLEPHVSRSDLIKTLLSTRLMVYLCVILIALLAGDYIKAWASIEPTNAYLVWVVVATYIITDFSNFFLQRYRMLGQAGKYATFVLAKTLVFPVLVFSLFFMLSPSVSAILVSTLIAVAVPLLLFAIADSKWLLPGRFDYTIFRRSISFGLPLVPAALAVLAVQVADRAMLRILIDEPEWALIVLGYYAFALKLANVTQLASGGFNIVWAPYVYKTYRNHGAPDIFRSIFSVYVLMLTILGGLIVLAAGFLVPMFMSEYTSAMQILVILFAAKMAYLVGDYFCIGIGIAEKTWIRAIAGFASLVVNISLNLFLIPKYGAVGAASATFVSAVLYIALLLFCSHRLYPVMYRFFTFFVIVFVFYAYGLLFGEELTGFVYFVITLILFAAFLFAGDLRNAVSMFTEPDSSPKPCTG